MKISVKRNMIPLFVLLFLIVLSKNFFGLIDFENVFFGFGLTNIVRLVFVFFIIYILLKYKKFKVKFNFSMYILLLIICVFIAVLQQKLITGQPINITFKEQVTYLIILVMYFPLKKLIVLFDIDILNILKSIMNLGVISSVLYILQKLLYINYNLSFLYIQAGDVGSFSFYRLYIGSSLVIISIICSIYFYFYEKKFRYIFYYILNMITLYWVSQSRLELIAISIVSLIGASLYIIRRKNYLLMLIIFIIGTIAIFSLNVQEIVDKNFRLGEFSITGDTLSIRELGRELYFTQLTENYNRFIFGMGYPSKTYLPAAEFSGDTKNIFLSDNGIYSFMYVYGILGLIIIVLLAYKFLKSSVKIYKKTSNSIFLLYLISIIIVMQNIALWYFNADGTLLLVLMLVLLEVQSERNNIKI